jgi:hypothetical protein
MFECVNLIDRFGDKYKIGWDSCYNPKGRPKEKLAPWYMTVPCERGTIYPHGDLKLGVMVDYRPITANLLAESGVCELYQDCDREKTFLFDVADFDTVAEIVKPRRKRRLTPEQREKNVERLKKYRFDSRTSERSQRPTTQRDRSTRATSRSEASHCVTECSGHAISFGAPIHSPIIDRFHSQDFSEKKKP